MANIAGLSRQLKLDMLGLFAGNALKAALYLATASLAPATTSAYTATGEVSGGGYTAGGVAVPAGAVSNVGTANAAWVPGGDVAFSAFTASAFDSVLLYDTARANKSLGIWNFGSQTVTNGTFTLTMPSALITQA